MVMKELTNYITEMRNYKCKNCWIITYIESESNPEPKVTYEKFEKLLESSFWAEFMNNLGDNEGDKHATRIINNVRLLLNTERITTFKFEDIIIIIKDADINKFEI